MELYRITLAKYATELRASGRAARWNSNDREVIYTSSSRALACLENIVHRSQIGLSSHFRVLLIQVPDDIPIKTIKLKDLPPDWRSLENLILTRRLGDQWLDEGKYGVLRVPSSIIPDEFNYLINPRHPDFKRIKLKDSRPFAFDPRISRYE